MNKEQETPKLVCQENFENYTLSARIFEQEQRQPYFFKTVD